MTSPKSQGIIRKGGDEKENRIFRSKLQFGVELARQTTSHCQSQLKSVSLKSQDSSF